MINILIFISNFATNFVNKNIRIRIRITTKSSNNNNPTSFRNTTNKPITMIKMPSKGLSFTSPPTTNTASAGSGSASTASSSISSFLSQPQPQPQPQPQQVFALESRNILDSVLSFHSHSYHKKSTPTNPNIPSPHCSQSHFYVVFLRYDRIWYIGNG